MIIDMAHLDRAFANMREKVCELGLLDDDV